MIREGVVVAAGMGTRLRAVDGPKPLVQVAGVPLVKRALLSMARAGIVHGVVVIGYRGDEVRAAIEGDPAYAAAGLAVDFVWNPEYEKPMGLSVLRAEESVRGSFVLSMSDHVYDDEILRLAAGADLSRAELVLCVDRRIDQIDDLDDATLVRTEEGRIVGIDKHLDPFDCVDCGIFAMTPAIFGALRAASVSKLPSLSDGVRILAGAGRARVLEIGDLRWQDVDTPQALALAEQMFGDGRAA